MVVKEIQEKEHKTKKMIRTEGENRKVLRLHTNRIDLGSVLLRLIYIRFRRGGSGSWSHRRRSNRLFRDRLVSSSLSFAFLPILILTAALVLV